ncbi:uncharacterized protein METZ01_LOCUS269546 [marine metagenome]|uniref:SAP domain-containing protein n=1 Tax=marine metagenome TaxID=408172 RepID=A0A382JZK6_9ZZZZ
METSTIIGLAIALVVVYLVYSESKKDKAKAGKPTKQSGVLRAGPKKKGRKSHSKTDLKKLTKNQLVELANKKNLKVKVSGKKAAVINEIHEQLDDEDDSDENADL